jgi:hypothetical protein
MNDKLDHISFTLACQLEDMGFRSVPIVSSNIWRYKEYKDLKAVFAPTSRTSTPQSRPD